MSNEIDELRQKALGELEGINSIKDLDSWRVRYLGRKSKLTETLRGLGSLPPEQRKVIGARANVAKASLEDSLRQKGQALRFLLENQPMMLT